MKVEKTTYGQFGECYKLDNDTIEVFVTAEMGPRVICYRLKGGQNIFGELGQANGVETEFGTWYPIGGHRLWHAPESNPRSYVPDNDLVDIEVIDGCYVKATQPIEQQTGIQKELIVALDEEGSGVTIVHSLTNENIWPIELSAWGLTIMRPGGYSIIPQEPYLPNTEEVLPARPLVLWHYTDLSDSRWIFGKKYMRLFCDESKTNPQKIGAMVTQGWGGYLAGEDLFIKRFGYDSEAKYTDFGCNFETFTEGSFLEVESVGALHLLEPGDTIDYMEHWHLFGGVKAGDTEESLDAALAPLVEQTIPECDCCG